MAYKDKNDPRLKAARLRWYYANKEKQAATRKEKEALLRKLLRELKDVPCTDCGVRYPYYVMQFDHISDDKRYEPARLIKSGSVALLIEETNKCEVVCGNCHAERTHQRLAETPHV